MNRKPVTIIWNARSGWNEGEEECNKVRNVLAEVDPEVEVQRIGEGQDITAEARKHIENGSKVLVAAGGDGTITAVACAVVKTDTALGVIPAGTLNHFARDLGISLNPEEAAGQLRGGKQITVDVGEVNGRVFLNNSVLGLYPVYRAARGMFESKGLGKSAFGRFFAVVGGIARAFWRLPHLRVRVVADGETRSLKTPFVLIANNEHELERGRIGKRAAMDRGHLWVYVMRHSSRWSLLKYFVQYVVGRFSKREVFEELQAKEVSIDVRRKRISVGIDGEIVKLKAPLQYRCLPGVLNVIAPLDCDVVEELTQETAGRQ